MPIFGICLGQQLLGLAYGGKTYKLKFGHRGANQPIKELATGKIISRPKTMDLPLTCLHKGPACEGDPHKPERQYR